MKRRNCEYDYVELMACPSGCLNGGGQLKAGQGQSQQQLLDQLDAIYHDPEVRPPCLSSLVLMSHMWAAMSQQQVAGQLNVTDISARG